jgi:formylglycine-generating enzyme required for sulfatase activity
MPKKFCVWLSQKEGASYRLPTDKEWSIAVGVSGMEKRTPATTLADLAAVELDHFPWGTDYVLETADKPGNYQDTVWKEISPSMPAITNYRDGYLTSAPVMSFRPNAVGLYDLGGNVWEWVEDGWNDEQKERVLRGGSFLDYGAALRSSARKYHPPGYRSPPFGFRVVLVLAK